MAIFIQSRPFLPASWNIRSPGGCLRVRMVYRVLLVLCCLAGALLAQTFQYSRGWTNGRKRSGPPSPHEAACQLQKLRIILEGKNTPQLYWPCDWQQNSPDYESHHVPQPPPLMDIDN